MAKSAEPWSQIEGRCFLSHAYADWSAVEQLTKRLAGTRASRVVFEPAKPDPANPVSNGIVPEILSCRSLIYLVGGRSAHSFWVSFERDYALRAGLSVYAYDPVRQTLRRDDSRPLSLRVQTFYHQNDEDRVDSLFKWMREQRHFELEPSVSRTHIGSMSGDTAVKLEELVAEGGVVLYLCGAASAGTIAEVYAPGFGSYLLTQSRDFPKAFAAWRMEGFTDERNCDEAKSFPYRDDEFYATADPYDYLHGVYARIDPDLQADWLPPGNPVLDLLTGATEGQFNWNRIDDLIVQLYAAMLAYEHRRAASPPVSHALCEEDLYRIGAQWIDEGPPERVRIGLSREAPSPWTLTLSEAQQLVERASVALSRSFGTRPTPVRAIDPDLPFDKGFRADFAYIWNWYPSIVELSMDIEGSRANVFLRRYPVPRHLRRSAKKVFDRKLASVIPHRS